MIEVSLMGFSNYLNNDKAYEEFKTESDNEYYIDKTLMIREMASKRFICVTRPRRFGKSVIASMIASFFGKNVDSSDVFDKFRISETEEYRKHMNKRNVIYITLNQEPFKCESYKEYIEFITSNMFNDLHKAYPDIDCETDDPILLLEKIRMLKKEKFMFVLDEWDYIFEASYTTKKDRKDYIKFLRNLLKGRSYVLSAYMTGILPIAKYSSGSDLNMFSEYTFVSSKFSSYFGFTESEVDELFDRYKALTNEVEAKVTRDGLTLWYNGYSTPDDVQMYNPFSVVSALDRNELSSYWDNSGPRDEIFSFIEKNVSDIRADIAIMIASEQVPFTFSANAISTSMDIETRDEMLSAMALYGLLSISSSKARIPNKEVMGKFASLLVKQSSLGYIHLLASKSKEVLKATLTEDTDAMRNILEERHDLESPIFLYSNENELAAVVNLAYLSARDNYDIVRENKGGKGYVDFLFFPFDRSDDCIILEPKVNDTPETAIAQIKAKKYHLAFQGIARPYTGRLLLVGISYSKKTKEHDCRIEVI
jgi:hypothetical protein